MLLEVIIWGIVTGVAANLTTDLIKKMFTSESEDILVHLHRNNLLLPYTNGPVFFQNALTGAYYRSSLSQVNITIRALRDVRDVNISIQGSKVIAKIEYFDVAKEMRPSFLREPLLPSKIILGSDKYLPNATWPDEIKKGQQLLGIDYDPKSRFITGDYYLNQSIPKELKFNKGEQSPKFDIKPPIHQGQAKRLDKIREFNALFGSKITLSSEEGQGSLPIFTMPKSGTEPKPFEQNQYLVENFSGFQLGYQSRNIKAPTEKVVFTDKFEITQKQDKISSQFFEQNWLNKLYRIRDENREKIGTFVTLESIYMDQLLRDTEAFERLRDIQKIILGGVGKIELLQNVGKYDLMIALTWDGPIANPRQPKKASPNLHYISIGIRERKLWVNEKPLLNNTPQTLREKLLEAIKNPGRSKK